MGIMASRTEQMRRLKQWGLSILGVVETVVEHSGHPKQSANSVHFLFALFEAHHFAQPPLGALGARDARAGVLGVLAVIAEFVEHSGHPRHSSYLVHFFAACFEAHHFAHDLVLLLALVSSTTLPIVSSECSVVGIVALLLPALAMIVVTATEQSGQPLAPTVAPSDISLS